ASWRSLLEKVREQARQGNEAGAVTAGEELLQQADPAEEPQGEEYRAALEELAEVFTQAEFWDAARAKREAVVDLQKRLHGTASWQYRDAKLALAHLEELRQLSPHKREQLKKANRLWEEYEELRVRGSYQAALERGEQAVALMS